MQQLHFPNRPKLSPQWPILCAIVAPIPDARRIAWLAAVSRKVFLAREEIAQFFNAPDSHQVVFTHNITMALNMVIRGSLNAGDHVVTTSMEHNSVLRPLRELERKELINLTLVSGDADGSIAPAAIAAAVGTGTRLVVVNHGSNVNGVIQDILAINAAVKSKNPQTKILIDSAQTAGVIAIDFQRLDLDFLAFTGHKGLLGPQGSGGLIIKKGITIAPLICGGTGSDSEFEYQPEFLPDHLESGTLNTPGIIGLAEAVRYIRRQNPATLITEERKLVARLIAGLEAIPGCRLYHANCLERQLGVISFNLDGISCSSVGHILSRDYGIGVRTGLHCAPAAHKTIGTFPAGTIRVSFGYFNCEADVDALTDAVAVCKKTIA